MSKIPNLYYFFNSECSKYEGSEDLIACPTPDAYKKFYCIEDRHLCDQRLNCPNGEDENLIGCMFYKWVCIRTNKRIDIHNVI